MTRPTRVGKRGVLHEMSELEQGKQDIHARMCHGQSVPKWECEAVTKQSSLP